MIAATTEVDVPFEYGMFAVMRGQRAPKPWRARGLARVEVRCVGRDAVEDEEGDLVVVDGRIRVPVLHGGDPVTPEAVGRLSRRWTFDPMVAVDRHRPFRCSWSPPLRPRPTDFADGHVLMTEIRSSDEDRARRAAERSGEDYLFVEGRLFSAAQQPVISLHGGVFDLALAWDLAPVVAERHPPSAVKVRAEDWGAVRGLLARRGAEPLLRTDAFGPAAVDTVGPAFALFRRGGVRSLHPDYEANLATFLGRAVAFSRSLTAKALQPGDGYRPVVPDALVDSEHRGAVAFRRLTAGLRYDDLDETTLLAAAADHRRLVAALSDASSAMPGLRPVDLAEMTDEVEFLARHWDRVAGPSRTAVPPATEDEDAVAAMGMGR